MGIGTGLAFIAIGAILAFALNVHVSGIDIQMIGWILMFVGAAWLAFTFAYTRPRRRRHVAEIVQDDPLFVSQEETPVEYTEPPVRPRSVSQAHRDITRYEPE
ncbi:DUF6458 family protein [Actinoallomurus purpureus]|uniref:DUF6458 family protein n=1 Tax=Actinoallomurus purpureus TaxID=478114 RepID=UPI0020929B68|nr:DUF6458 family protein [Actinoallomurus purpureus]MCO6007304.1 DUF6458 family protein [Actinoallomurus purpureus]